MVEVNTSFLCILLLSLSSLSFLYIIFWHRSHPQTRIPCPESYPVIGNTIGFLRNCHRFHDWVVELFSTTHSLTIQVNGFLGVFHSVCTINPINLEHILRSNFSNYVKGSRFNSVVEDLFGQGIFNADGDMWTIQRKIASHEFNTKSLRNFISETVQSHISNRLIPLLTGLCETEEIVDLQDIFRKFAFDNICNVAFGVDPAWLAADNRESPLDSLFVRSFDYAVDVNSNRFMHPMPAVWKMKKFLNIGSEKRYKEAVEAINSYAMNIITGKEKEQQMKREKDEVSNQDLLSRFMFSSSDYGFSNEDDRRKFLRDIVISFILAGKDSTSTALTWFFWVIAGHPRCAQLIRKELSVIVLESSSADSPASFTYNDLKKLHYLHAALSESLRLFPPVPINSRMSLSDDTLPDGTLIRKGWFADYSPYAAGRMEALWGPDCLEFKPERWLDVNGVFQAIDQFKFPVFHGGPRICLGKEMAYVQMKSVAAAVMYEFEIEAIDGGGRPGRILDPPYILSLVLKMKGGFRVKLKRYQQLNN